jgi:hypothetical protein
MAVASVLHRCGRVRAAALTVVALAHAVGVASASDFFHECEPLDGSRAYGLDATWVVRRADSGETIKPASVNRQRLRLLSGTCNNNTRTARYRFSTEIYGVTVEFVDQGTTVQRRFRCERTEDATPAGLSCEREVWTIDWQAPARVYDAFR